MKNFVKILWLIKDKDSNLFVNKLEIYLYKNNLLYYKKVNNNKICDVSFIVLDKDNIFFIKKHILMEPKFSINKIIDYKYKMLENLLKNEK